ncbi:MAG: thioredoxin domain-containing protein, partial [Flammeovirgaceae bacterium]|nr:thioredoxin domain-containing protein [Flammeovirgaceae bacterium]
GNWEHGMNILIRPANTESFFKKNNLTATELDELTKKSKPILLKERENKIRPGLDDKIVTSWNAMMIVGLIDAYKAFGDRQFLEAAEKNIQFLEKYLFEEGKIYRSFKNKRSDVEGFLDDYAYVIAAYVQLYQCTFSEIYIDKASHWMNHPLQYFYDKEEGFFFYTSSDSEKLISRKKEIFDNVIPSSNAVMARTLNHLGIILDREDWKELSKKMVSGLSHLIESDLNYMSYWGIAYMETHQPLAEVVMIGDQIEALNKELHQAFQPFAVVMGTLYQSSLPLVADKKAADGKSTIFVCYNKTCQLPVHSVEEALLQIQRK